MVAAPLTLHPILTAETHNFPSGVAPFPGAETGTGGRLRDVQATGRGAHTVAGIRYCMLATARRCQLRGRCFHRLPRMTTRTH